jgi:hypothetical protein
MVFGSMSRGPKSPDMRQGMRTMLKCREITLVGKGIQGIPLFVNYLTMSPKSSASTSSATPATGIATNMASVYNTAFFAAATELTLKYSLRSLAAMQG